MIQLKKEDQFADLGHHYETVIFYHDEKQKEEAEESKEKLDKSGLYDRPIVTKIWKAETFYIAERLPSILLQEKSRPL